MKLGRWHNYSEKEACLASQARQAENKETRSLQDNDTLPPSFMLGLTVLEREFPKRKDKRMSGNTGVMKRWNVSRMSLFMSGILVVLVILLFGMKTVNATSNATPTDHSSLPPGFTQGYVHTNGIRLHYVQAGQGTPIVLLHGFPENAHEWYKVMPALAQHYHVIALDMRGAGQSDAPPTGYDKTTLAQDVHGVVQQLHLGSINLAGHDIGSMVAYFYAAMYPTEVRHLVLMEAPIPDSQVYTYPALTANGPGLWWFGMFNTPSMPQTFIQGRENQFIAEFYKYSVPPVVAGSITQEDLAIYAQDLRGTARLNAYASYFGTIPQDVLRVQQLGQTKLTMPVLAIGADHSLGAELGKQAQQYATNVQSVVFTNSGHWIPEEYPQKTVQYLTSFFAK